MTKEENKYYTPTIEEFYVGFEYEIENFIDKDGSFLKRTYGVDTGNLHSVRIDDILFEKEILKKVRVKYLNYKDIIELGWVEDDGLFSEDLILSHGKKYYKIKRDHNVFYIDISDLKINTENQSCYNDNAYTCVNIFVHNKNTMDNSLNKERIFSGTIKNKSELKKLMIQLNINYVKN